MIAPVEVMNRLELIEYIEKLEEEVQELRAKTDNTHKLSPEEVRLIRRSAAMYTYAELAEEFCVKPETIRRTVLGEYHRDVT